MKLYKNLCVAIVQGLDTIFTEKKYADKVIEKLFKTNPKWGARDRKFVAETMYDIVRWHRLYTELAHCDRTDFWTCLGVWCLHRSILIPEWSEFNKVDPDKISKRHESIKNKRAIRESFPDWLDTLCEKELGKTWDREIEALNEQADVVLRCNTLIGTRDKLQELLYETEVETTALQKFPDALVLNIRQNIFKHPLFKEGWFEVQDAGSQLIAPYLQPAPGLRIIDACAGAGGKSLHLAALMQNKGRIISLDTEAWKLEELKKRARRAHVSNIETRVIDAKTIKHLKNSADRLLLDVPCSGTGVLKRNPDSKWKLSKKSIEQVQVKQQEIISEYSTMLKTGGLMVYATCSILPSENGDQVNTFIKNNPSFSLVQERQLFPSDGFDGFYIALLRRN